MSTKRPTGPGWSSQPVPPLIASSALESAMWWHLERGVGVISCIEHLDDIGGPQHHVSFAMLDGTAAPRWAARFVREQFGMRDAEEDHVEGGSVRNLWLHMDASATNCECKDEVEVVAPIGDAVGDGGDEYVTRGDDNPRVIWMPGDAS